MAKKPLPLSFRRRAEKLATDERAALGLTPTCRLDPRALAARHSIKIVELSELPGVSDEARAHLLKRDSKDLSALCVGHDDAVVIIVNDSHTPQRQANSICHEVAHVLLGHTPGEILDHSGVRVYPERQEDEASWLAGALLVPVKGLRLLHSRQARSQIEENYGVSPELLRWRCNMHGLAKRNQPRAA
jgi:Zn-dependent peptidase ImmA (M78 family)